MDYVPIKIENSSDSGLANGQKVRSPKKDGEQFGTFLSGFLESENKTVSAKKSDAGAKAKGGQESSQHTESVAIVAKKSPADQKLASMSPSAKAAVINYIDGKHLTEAEKKKVDSFLAKILSQLKGNAEGQKLLKAWENGKIQLLVPVSIQDGDTQQAGTGYLLIQPHPDSQGKSNNLSHPAFSYQLLFNQVTTGSDEMASVQQTKTAGEFQIRNGQIHFKSPGAGDGKIPLILFANEKTTVDGVFAREGNGSTQSTPTPAEFINAGRVAAQQRGATGGRSQGQADGSSARLVFISPNQGTSIQTPASGIGQGQLLGKGLSGEIAGLLESLKGEMKVKVSSEKGTAKKNVGQGPGKSQGRIEVRAASHANMVRTHGKVASTIQPAQNTHQSYLADAAGTEQAAKNLAREFLRPESDQMSEGQSISFSQLMQKPVSEVLANGQPKAPVFQVIQKIEAMVQAAKAQRTLNQPQALKAQLVLHPKHLGSVHLNLQFHDDTLSGTILAASKEVKALIEHSLPALKHALHNQHTGVNHLDVEVRSELSQENAQNWFLQEQSGQHRNRDSWAEFQPEEGEVPGTLSDAELIPPVQTRTPDYSGNGRLELYA